MAGENGNLDRYLGLINDSVKRIESKLDKITDDHHEFKDVVDGRFRTIENKMASDDGSKKTASSMWGAVSGTVSAVIVLVAQAFIQPRY